MKKIFLLFFIFILFLPPSCSISIPPPSFFITEDGTPNVLIVTGEDAAAEDIVSASLLASKIGQMAVRAEEETYRKSEKVKQSSYAFMPASIVPNPYLDIAATYALSPLYFPPSPLVDPHRYNEIVLTPVSLSTLFYFDENFVDYHGNDDGRFQYFETHEEIILRFYDALSFDQRAGFFFSDHIVDLYGGDFLGEFEVAQAPVPIAPSNGATNVCPQTSLQFDWSDSTGTAPLSYQIQVDDDIGFGSPEVNQSNLATSNYIYTGPPLIALTMYYWHVRATNEYGTSAWSAVHSFTPGTCSGAPPPPPTPLPTLSPFLLPPPPPPPGRIYPSITYRVAPIYLPRYLVASSQFLDTSEEVGSMSEGFYAIPEPQIFLRHMMPKLYFFDKTYYVIDAGEAYKNVAKGEYDVTLKTNYLVYGIPYYYSGEYVQMGQTRYFNNYGIRLDEVDLDHNKARITITEPDFNSRTFWMVLKPIHGFSPSPQKEGAEGQQAAENWNGASMGDVAALTSGDIVQEKSQFYTIAGMDITGKNNIIVYLLLDGIAVFHGNNYNGLMFNLYILDEWGRFYDRKCCFPYIEEPNRYALDIFRAGTITFPDTTSYDVWGMDVDLCDDMLNRCPSPFFVEGPLSYFNIAFEDWEFVEKDGDDLSFWVEKSLPIQTIYRTVQVRFSPETIIRLDSEVTDNDKRNRNLILIGGPVANSETRWLVENEKSRIDWYRSDGDWEFIHDPFGLGHDGLVVAGSDRKATRLSALELVRRLG